MTKEYLRQQFGAMSYHFLHGRAILEKLSEHLDNEIDQRAVKSMLTDLAWIVENCKVISLHQEGKALDDTMGFTPEKK